MEFGDDTIILHWTPSGGGPVAHRSATRPQRHMSGEYYRDANIDTLFRWLAGPDVTRRLSLVHGDGQLGAETRSHHVHHRIGPDTPFKMKRSRHLRNKIVAHATEKDALPTTMRLAKKDCVCGTQLVMVLHKCCGIPHPARSRLQVVAPH